MIGCNDVKIEEYDETNIGYDVTKIGYNQVEDYGLSRHKQDLVDNIDAWAMWISPPLFVIWNFFYWLVYQL